MPQNTIEIITADIQFPSPFTHRVQLLCHEKNIPYQLTLIDVYKKPAWFLEIAPLGQVPVMRLNNLVISDSRAICEYIDSISEPHFLPTEPLERAKHQASIAMADEFAQAITQFIKQRKTEITDLIHLNKFLKIINNQIRYSYFMGEEISLVDIAFISHLLWLDALEEKVFQFSLIKNYSRLENWFQHVCARASVSQTTKDFKFHFINKLKEKNLLTQFDK